MKVVAVACLASLAACSDGPVTKLDVDVVMSRGEGEVWVQVYPREVVRSCDCTSKWPPIGTCIQLTDVVGCGCDPHPAACLSSVRLERDGAVVGEADPDADFRGAYHLRAEGVTDRLTLILDGCGGRAAVALPDEPAPVPVIQEIRVASGELRLSWDAPSPGVSATLVVSHGFGGPMCHDAFDGDISVPVSGSFEGYSPWMDLDSYIDGQARQTELGLVRVWSGADADTPANVQIPIEVGLGRWALPAWTVSTADAIVDGIGHSGSIEYDLGYVSSFASPAPDVAATIWVFARFIEAGGIVGDFSYRADPTVDVLEWTPAGGGALYRGAFPHVAPADDLDLGGLVGGDYAVTLAGVTLTNELDPADTITLSLSFRITFDPIPRPE